MAGPFLSFSCCGKAVISDAPGPLLAQPGTPPAIIFLGQNGSTLTPQFGGYETLAEQQTDTLAGSAFIVALKQIAPGVYENTKVAATDFNTEGGGTNLPLFTGDGSSLFSSVPSGKWVQGIATGSQFYLPLPTNFIQATAGGPVTLVNGASFDPIFGLLLSDFPPPDPGTGPGA